MKSTKILAMITVLFLLAVVFSACEFGPKGCEHDWLDATCTEPKTCNICAETEGDPLGHKEETVAGKAATCTEAGLTDGKKCSACGTVLLAQEAVPAAGHKDEDADYVCDVCKIDLCTNHIPSDAVKENEVAPTCTTLGSYELVVRCSACKEELSREKIVVDMIDHTPDEAVRENEVASTCTAEGSYDSVIKCSVCSAEISREAKSIDKLPHTEEVIAAQAPTCTETGLTEGKKCSACGETLVAQEMVSAAGHKDEDGNYKCDACGTDLCTDHVEEIIPGTPATCTEGGISDGKKCSRCGEILEEQHSIEALGHAYEAATYIWSEDNSTCTATITCANDSGHTVSEIARTDVVELSINASNAEFIYSVAFEDANFEAQISTVGAVIEAVDGIATINAPAMEGRVPSHDYVKFDISDAAATYTFTIYYSEVDVWDGTSVSTSLVGKGTAEDPYLIQSGADLAYIAKAVNALAVKTAAFSGEYFVMTKSIDLNGHEFHIGTGSGWGDRQIFGGYLDGNNCSIRGINNTLSLFGCVEGGWVKNLSLYGNVEVAKGHDSVGVFVGYLRLAPLENITNYANITGNGNVGGLVGNMEQSSDTPSKNLVNYGTVKGVQNVGGIAGLLGRYLTDSVNWGDVSGTSNIGGVVANLYWACGVIDCDNYGTVSGEAHVGGIAGIRNGSISASLSGCTNNGTVVGTACTSTGVDGITSANVTITECVNNGKVELLAHDLTHTDAKDATCEEAGNVAYDYCSICKKNYDADGNVLSTVVIDAKGHAWDEGVVVDGKITFTCQNDASHTKVEDAKYTVTVNYLNLDGSVAAAAETLEFAYNEIATINAKAIEGLVASHDYVKVHVLGSSSVTIYYSQVDVWDGTSVSTSLSGSGTAEDPYLIQSAADFAYFAGQLNAVEGAAGVNYKVTTFKGQYFRMTKSVDLNGNYLIAGFHVGWNNYQGFFGYFDGNNCSIRGINIDNSTGTTSTALFGCINAGSLKNLSVYGSVKGNSTTSAVVAYTVSNAVVENVTNYATVTSVTSGDRTGTVGGIVANQESSAGAIINCVNYGTVTCDSYIVGGIAGSGGAAITNCVNWVDVTGGNESLGGIAGTTKNKGTITGCVNYGDIACTVTGFGKIGGIVGNCVKPVSDCVNYGTVTGTISKGVDGICGKTSSTVTNCVNNGTVEEFAAE